MQYFDSKFKRQKTPSGNYQYWFSTIYKQSEELRNEKPPLAVDGEIFSFEGQMTDEEETRDLCKLPEEVYNPVISRQVLTQWISDCSGAFVKPPTIEQCLANVQNIFDSNSPVAGIRDSEESSSWLLQWVPTKIIVDIPVYQIYWAPCYKIEENTRIPELSEDTKIPEYHTFQVKDPERVYTMNTRVISPGTQTDWLHEVTESTIPMSDIADLRLDLNPEVEAQREKYRRRVREARIRAKLAKYRAERLAQRYEEKFGLYPDEDEEEAQTEVEQSDED
jgi:hypothetical protein